MAYVGHLVGNTVIAVDLLTIDAVVGRLAAALIRGSAFELVLVEIDCVAALFRVIGEHVPRQRMVALAHADPAAAAHPGIRAAAVALADHEMLDRAELVAVAV